MQPAIPNGKGKEEVSNVMERPLNEDSEDLGFGLSLMSQGSLVLNLALCKEG